MDIKKHIICDSQKITAKPHIICTAHYWPPDEASTGQLLAELAENLLTQFEVTAICVVPSYTGKVPDNYKTQKYYLETLNGVDLIRVCVPEFNKTDKVSRMKNIVTYFFRSMRAMKRVKDSQGKHRVDYVLSVSQPPILGGLLGVWGKWTLKDREGKRSKFIYQIQDFNPEQVLAVNYSKSKLVTGLMMWLDKFSCKRADLVITVGRDLAETLKKRFQMNPEKMPRVTLINNWIDETSIYPLEADNEKVVAFKKKYGLEDKFVIMYSGNIGLYYDLENLIKVIRKFKPGMRTVANKQYPQGQEVVFAFVGAGSILNKLVIYKEQNHLDNVIFIPYQDKEDLNYSLNAGDVHWCVNAKGIKGVSCPSKYYGLAAVGKPVLGVLESGSEVRCLIEETKGGLVCEPGDYEHVERHIQWFIDNAGSGKVVQMGQNGYEYLHRELTRAKSVKKYMEEILKL